MARVVETRLIDDISGVGDADTTVFVTPDGLTMEIDIAEENLARLNRIQAEFSRKLAVFIEKGRRVTNRTQRKPVRSDTKAIRAWAITHGLDVSSRGRIRAEIVELYNAG